MSANMTDNLSCLYIYGIPHAMTIRSYNGEASASGGGFLQSMFAREVGGMLPSMPSITAQTDAQPDAQKLRFWVPSALRAPAPG